MTCSEKAHEIHKQGFNCAQAVFAAFAENYGITREQALKLCASFGGGLAGSGECCGAALGMLMALGMAEGFAQPDMAKKQAHNARVREAMKLFEERFGAVRCPDLKGGRVPCAAISLPRTRPPPRPRAAAWPPVRRPRRRSPPRR